MSNIKFEEISIIGRITYGIMCAEEYLLHIYPDKNWKIIFDKIWEITSLDLWDQWVEEMLEIIPEFLYEFNTFEEAEFEYLSKNKYNEIKQVYENTGEDVNTILKLVYNLANSHAYSSIEGIGKESLYELQKIMDFLESKEIACPESEGILENSLSKNNGWGNPVSGKSFSKII